MGHKRLTLKAKANDFVLAAMYLSSYVLVNSCMSTTLKGGKVC